MFGKEIENDFIDQCGNPITYNEELNHTCGDFCNQEFSNAISRITSDVHYMRKKNRHIIPMIKELLARMLDINPRTRASADDCLKLEFVNVD